VLWPEDATRLTTLLLPSFSDLPCFFGSFENSPRIRQEVERLFVGAGGIKEQTD
jgi:hypothetical protein